MADEDVEARNFSRSLQHRTWLALMKMQVSLISTTWLSFTVVQWPRLTRKRLKEVSGVMCTKPADTRTDSLRIKFGQTKPS